MCETLPPLLREHSFEVFENRLLGRLQVAAENCLMMRFIICTPPLHQLIFW